ncbi:hypothetical protein FGE12_23810 [Aggregicoccus sp. 17bor-14]|uniref:AMIN-like domain-containing (lipo)protein n=1 Tax=Myxococcaceae TaxID=31 RepID=UPI00129C29BD|nr:MULTISPECIES: hypothetical protein [Myxococcaceae]MBF5045454.1 hypothetical protein [Simulacricoccus sp. 17bor-14]MRI91192.1 hypothetical protein [Aggregicoccus sp. 17bor-14]
MRRTPGLALLTLAALASAACKREEPPAAQAPHAASPGGPDAGSESVPAQKRPLPPGTAARPDTPGVAGPGLAVPTDAGIPAADGGTIATDGGSAASGSTNATSAGSVSATAADAGTASGAASGSTGTWTAGVVEKARSKAQAGSVQLAAVRAAKQPGYDRVVFELSGDALPGYHLEYVDRPIVRCGSGEPTQVAGQAWLQVRLTGAQAHTDAGKPTVGPRERKESLGVLRELEQTCDFEGEVTWVLGLQHPNRFRVLELKAPTRLVVDVQQ